MAKIENFSLKEVFEVVIQDPSTKEIIRYSDDVKTSNVEFTVDLVYTKGGRGDLYIGRAKNTGRRGTATIDVATWNTRVIAAQAGTEIIAGEDANYYETLTVSSNAATTTFTAQGTANAEIGMIQHIDSSGNVVANYTQVASTPATGQFQYVSGTKAITFFSGDLADGSTVRLVYAVDMGSDGQTIVINGQSTPELVLITMFGVASDLCTNDEYECQVTGLMQLDGMINMTTGATDDPAMQSIGGEFVRGCNSMELARIHVFSDGDLT